MFYNIEGKVSKTKVGTVIVGVAVVLTTLGNWLTGSSTFDLALLTKLLTEIGAVMVALGIRDLPLLNTTEITPSKVVSNANS